MVVLLLICFLLFTNLWSLSHSFVAVDDTSLGPTILATRKLVIRLVRMVNAYGDRGNYSEAARRCGEDMACVRRWAMR